ncbi:MAG: hypothetical protein ABL956_10885 [Hyphomonadaceae bacterium]
MKLRRKLGIIAVLVVPAACSTAVNKTQAGLGNAAMAPLTDLNLRRTEVPALLEAIKSPYEPIPTVSCQAIAANVRDLTIILGPDSDASPQPEASLADQAGAGAADITLNTVSSTMTDFIPFRSIVREASGASAHARKLRAAYERGLARRSYLKGVGAQLGCAPPAAPEPNAGIAKPPPKIEYRSNVQPD